MRLYVSILLVICTSVIWCHLSEFSFASPGNAEVARAKNLQYFQLEPGEITVTRCRNLAYFQLEPNNIDTLRFLNLQYFQLEQGNIDTLRYRNLQYFQIEQGNAEVTRYRNLQYFILEETLRFEVNIRDLTITNQNGTPTNNFMKGDVVQFNFTIENTGNFPLIKGLISAIILDPTNTPVFLSYTFEDVNPETLEQFIIGYQVPLSALSGLYTIKIMVFTDWPSKGGVGLDIEISTFNVT